jgi:hypothetical protein
MITLRGHRSRTSTLISKAHKKFISVVSFSSLSWKYASPSLGVSRLQMLPLELRILIWEFVLGLTKRPERIHLISMIHRKRRRHKTLFSISNQLNLRVALQVCRDSAAIISMLGYRRYNGPYGSSLYLRYQDYLDFQNIFHLKSYIDCPYWTTPRPTQEIQRLSIRFRYYPDIGYLWFREMVWKAMLQFPNLYEIIFYFDMEESPAGYFLQLDIDRETIKNFWYRLLVEDIQRKIAANLHLETWEHEGIKNPVTSLIIPEMKFLTTFEFIGKVVKYTNVSVCNRDYSL